VLGLLTLTGRSHDVNGYRGTTLVVSFPHV
jgi:hypothetical protein